MIKHILFAPLQCLYFIGLSLHKGLYNLKIKKTATFEDILILKVGNLSMGGTGKTPHVVYLLQRILKKYSKVSMISRGYGRKTSNVMSVNINSTANEVGDEPLLIKNAQPDALVYVAEKRAEGIIQLQADMPSCKIVVLDDAMQHWSLKGDKNILLTSFDKPFFEDYLLPLGTLREPRKGAARADIIIITKSPVVLEEEVRQYFIESCRKYNPHAPIIFSFYNYGQPYLLDAIGTLLDWRVLKESSILMLTGIAHTEYLMEFITAHAAKVDLMKYADHHHYNNEDIKNIIKNAQKRGVEYILTTEKDASRLLGYKAAFEQANIPVFVLPIEVDFQRGDGLILQNWLDALPWKE